MLGLRVQHCTPTSIFFFFFFFFYKYSSILLIFFTQLTLLSILYSTTSLQTLILSILPFSPTISNFQDSSEEFKFGSGLRRSVCYSVLASNNKISLLLIPPISLLLVPLFLSFGFFELRIFFIINFFIHYNGKYRKS